MFVDFWKGWVTLNRYSSYTKHATDRLHERGGGRRMDHVFVPQMEHKFRSLLSGAFLVNSINSGPVTR